MCFWGIYLSLSSLLVQTGGVLQRLCRPNTVLSSFKWSVCLLPCWYEWNQKWFRAPLWPDPRGQAGVAAVISTEMGNYYWSYCGVAVTHVKGSCLVVYVCVCICMLTVRLHKSIYRLHVVSDWLCCSGTLKLPCILPDADWNTQNKELRQQMMIDHLQFLSLG